jgi:hypothetical protein
MDIHDMKRPTTLLLITALGLAGCQRAADPDQAWAVPAIDAATAPAPPGSRYPNLARASDGRVVLSWVAPAPGDAYALQYATWTDGAWSTPATVATGRGWFVNWADFAAVAPLGGGLWAAHWLEQRPGSVYSYDVRMSVSRDEGRTWSPALTPHRDGTPTEHGFVSTAGERGEVAAVWLDGRNTAGHDQDSENGSPQTAMSLRTARIDAQGHISGGEAELDARVCDCCQTDIATTSEGLVVAYRDRSEDELRDISVVRTTKDGWSAPSLVHRDGWRIAACPVNGPALAAQGTTVAVAWFTAPDTPRVRLAFSDDEGRSFAAPLEVAAGRLAGRVDVVLLDEHRAAVSWLADGASGAEIRAQLWSRQGPASAPLTVARTSVERASGFPRMAIAGRALHFAWTDTSTTPIVRTALFELP